MPRFKKSKPLAVCTVCGKPNRVFLGAAYNGPTSWKGPKAARTGPFTASRWSRDTFAQTGGALAVLRVVRAGAAGQVGFARAGHPTFQALLRRAAT